MARMRSGDRVHVFESLSELQAIQSASRNKILQPFACDLLVPLMRASRVPQCWDMVRLHRRNNDGGPGRVGSL